MGLVGCIPIWLLCIPASGQSRIIQYGYALFAPFVAALPGGWGWFFVLLAWGWPVEINAYDETGGETFVFAK